MVSHGELLIILIVKLSKYAPLNRELVIRLNKNMFARPNKEAFIAIMLYLLDVLGKQNVCGGFHIGMDAKADASFRKYIVDTVNDLNKNWSDIGRIMPMQASSFIAPSGDRTIAFLQSLIKFSMKYVCIVKCDVPREIFISKGTNKFHALMMDFSRVARESGDALKSLDAKIKEAERIRNDRDSKLCSLHQMIKEKINSSDLFSEDEKEMMLSDDRKLFEIFVEKEKTYFEHKMNFHKNINKIAAVVDECLNQSNPSSDVAHPKDLSESVNFYLKHMTDIKSSMDEDSLSPILNHFELIQGQLEQLRALLNRIDDFKLTLMKVKETLTSLSKKDSISSITDSYSTASDLKKPQYINKDLRRSEIRDQLDLEFEKMKEDFLKRTSQPEDPLTKEKRILEKALSFLEKSQNTPDAAEALVLMKRKSISSDNLGITKRGRLQLALAINPMELPLFKELSAKWDHTKSGDLGTHSGQNPRRFTVHSPNPRKFRERTSSPIKVNSKTRANFNPNCSTFTEKISAYPRVSVLDAPTSSGNIVSEATVSSTTVKSSFESFAAEMRSNSPIENIVIGDLSFDLSVDNLDDSDISFTLNSCSELYESK